MEANRSKLSASTGLRKKFLRALVFSVTAVVLVLLTSITWDSQGRSEWGQVIGVAAVMLFALSAAWQWWRWHEAAFVDRLGEEDHV
ncbi:MAG: hypothetical protein AAGG38_05205 [Planctomycetota bacterium]